MTGIPACWTWPVTEADHEQAYRAATAGSDRERERIDEERFVSWHAGRCALCGGLSGDPGLRRLVWDHDHDTGYARGLLCGSCNAREAHSALPEFARYRSRPPAAILGFSLFYAEPSSVAGIWGSQEAADEAVRRWMDEHDPELPRHSGDSAVVSPAPARKRARPSAEALQRWQEKNDPARRR